MLGSSSAAQCFSQIQERTLNVLAGGGSLLTLPALVFLGLDGHAELVPWMWAGQILALGALVVLLRVVDRGQLHRFAPYCWLVGTITLFLAWLG